MAERQSFRVGPPATRETPAFEFPEAGEFVIFSRPEFFLQSGERGEVVVCDARIRLSVGEPAPNARGLRQVSVKVLEWEAVGRSSMLGADLRFVATESQESHVEAGSERADLPGRMVLAIRSSTFVGDMQVDSHESRAVGLISAFPPAPGDVFSLEAPSTEHPLFALSGGKLQGSLTIRPGLCKCAQ